MVVPDEPFYECPRYSKCSVNNCPLSKAYNFIYVDETDNEKKCNLPKSYRLKIACNYPGVLQYEGLTKREFNARKIWNEKTDDERAECAARLKKYHFVHENQTDAIKQV